MKTREQIDRQFQNQSSFSILQRDFANALEALQSHSPRCTNIIVGFVCRAATTQSQCSRCVNQTKHQQSQGPIVRSKYILTELCKPNQTLRQYMFSGNFLRFSLHPTLVSRQLGVIPCIKSIFLKISKLALIFAFGHNCHSLKLQNEHFRKTLSQLE